MVTQLVILRDAIAIALMLCWAGIIFLLAILFRKGYRRLEDKLEELKGTTTEFRRDCFSVKWEQNLSKRKIIVVRSILFIIPMVVAGVIVYVSLHFYISLGYAIFIPFLGLPILLDDAFEMYRYSRAVREVPLEMLQDKDMEYMEEAIEVLATKPKIYFIAGLIFSVAALFIPQLFNLLPQIMTEYFRLALLLSEKLGIIGPFAILVPFIALPTALLIKYKWTIRQIMTIKRIIQSIKSKLRTNES